MLMSEVASDLEVVVFDTHAGALIVRSTPEGYTLDLPRKQRAPWTPPDGLAAALGVEGFADAFVGEYANVVLEDEASVVKLKPEIAAINTLVRGPRQGCLVVTAPADEGKPYDFVSRFFAPGIGLNEDPVTGSSFADLAPYWCDRFDMDSIVGYQASKRGGYMRAMQTLSSVRILGQIAVYLRGELDPSISRLHNRAAEEPEAPKRKKRRGKNALPPIFEDPVLPGLEPAPPPREEAPPRPPTSHPAPPPEPPAPRIVVTEGE
jgi:predicted PhzF superfamily epimerase YddE/YHI9